MTRQERVALHTNQKRMQLSGDMPNEKSLVEGKPEYRETFKGLYQYVKYNNEVYSQLLTKDTRTLQEEINDTVNNITVNNLTVTDPIDVEDGGTGHTTLSDGYVLLGNGTSSLNQLDVTTSGAIVIGDGTTAPTTYNAFSSSTGTLNVSAGGTGASSLTDHGVLVGSGTSGVTPLTVGSNGQILVGSTGADPVFATLTCDDGLSASTGAGTLEIDLDLKSAGGLAIESNELALSLGDASITGTLAVGDGGTGATTFTSNAILTGNTTSAIQAEADLLFASNVVYPTATAHNVAGKTLTISAGDTTAGTTNDIAGGALTFQGGQGKGTGAGGDIIFQTANAAGSTASSLNALATALTISDDLSSTFGGSILGSPVSVYSTGDLTLDSNLDIILDCGASGDNIFFKNNGATRCNWGLATAPSLNVTGAFTIDGSSTMELDAVGVFTVSHDGTDQIVGDTSAHLYFNAYNTTKHTNDYGINNQGNLYMFTTGNADYKQNYTFLSYFHEPSGTGADLFEAYPS